jgi:hypothetical protein
MASKTNSNNEKSNKKKTNFGHLLTGAISGGISRTATSPLERLRILQ